MRILPLVLLYGLGSWINYRAWTGWYRGVGEFPESRGGRHDRELLYMWGVIGGTICWPVCWVLVGLGFFFVKLVVAIARMITSGRSRREQRHIKSLMKKDAKRLEQLSAATSVKDEYGTLWEIAFRDGRKLAFLDLKDSTTSKPVRIRVPAGKGTPQVALAWTFDSPVYRPVQQT